MPKPKKKIGLIATAIEFTYFAIVYKVRYEGGSGKYNPKLQGIVACNEDIKEKDLNLKPTILSEEMEVVFSTVYMTPHFYQSLLEKTRKDFEEYRTELNNIYHVGQKLGYILV